MSNILKYCVGIDVSSQELEASFGELATDLRIKVSKSRKFKNTKSHFKSLHQWIEKRRKSTAPVCIILEATGVYHERITHFLHTQGYEINVVLPNKARRYLQSLGHRSKNDTIDCNGLTQMGLQPQQLDIWYPPSAVMMELRALTRQRQNLQEQITVLNNRLHAIKNSYFCSSTVQRQLKQNIRWCKKQIQQLEQQMMETLGQQPALKAKVERIVNSIKGVGIITLLTIIAETNAFEMFHSIQQLTKYAGYDVIENQSGKFRGRERISKRGNARIRRILHLPALNMVTYDVGTFSQTYERIVAKTGIKMKAYVAIQRKLLILLYTLWKNDDVFHQSYRSKLAKLSV